MVTLLPDESTQEPNMPGMPAAFMRESMQNTTREREREGNTSIISNTKDKTQNQIKDNS